ncbi:MAG TPA: hypothetical protein GX688_05495 [Clostridiales bacterium]|nr:hypothetical protein [Clostridiales bacterium]
MKCRVCGYDLDPNKAFCDMCGTRTVPPEASPESAQRETNVPHSLFSHPFSAGETMPPAEVPTHRESRPHVSQAPWPTEPPLCEQAMARLKKADDLFDEEFSWNVHDFPKPKKPRDIPIEWPDYDAPETRAKFIEQSEGRIQEAIDKKEPVVLVSSDASEGFIAVPDAPVSSWNEPLAGVSLHDERARPTDYQLHDERAMPSSIPQPDAWTMPAAPPATDDLAWLDEQIKSDPVTREEERFFTFQKKNEEFQRLLDQEQERINSRKYGEPYRDDTFRLSASPVVRAEELSEFERMLAEGTKDASTLTGDTMPINLAQIQQEAKAQEEIRMEARARERALEEERIRGEERARAQGEAPSPGSIPMPTPQVVTTLPVVPPLAEPKSVNQARLEAMSQAREEYLRSLGMGQQSEEETPAHAEREPSVQTESMPGVDARIPVAATQGAPVELGQTAGAQPDATIHIPAAYAPDPPAIPPQAPAAHSPDPAAAGVQPGTAGHSATAHVPHQLAGTAMPADDQRHDEPAIPAGTAMPADDQRHDEPAIPAGTAMPAGDQRHDEPAIPAGAAAAGTAAAAIGAAGVAASAPPSSLLSDTAERSMEELFAIPADEPEERPVKSRKRGGVFKFLLILILLILLAEVAVIGLRHYLPEHETTKSATRIEQTIIINAKAGVARVKELVDGLLAKTGWFGEEPDPEEDPYGVEDDDFDFAAVVRINNDNIESITISPKLHYDASKIYKPEGLGDAAVVEDGGTRADIYGCIIAYNSTWVDYVNTGEDDTCFLYLLKDGPAYNAAASYTGAGEVSQRFEMLALGEVRTDGDFYYAFAREQIELEESGKTSKHAYAWVYRLQDVAGEIKIVDYTPISE